MRHLVPGFALLATIAGAGPALAADAVTYSGTVGAAPAILELSSAPGEGPVAAGRYAYLAKGGDIPLHGTGGEGGLRFAEEKPCTVKLCGDPAESPADNPADRAPLGADWTLEAAADGSLSGTWRDRASGKTLPLAFVRRAMRGVDVTNYSPLEALDPDNAPVQHGDMFALEPDLYPYDFLKLDWPLKPGRQEKLGKGVYRLDLDRRTGLPYPTVVSLGAADIDPVNAFLRQARLQEEMAAFRCQSAAYLGYGWNNSDAQGSNGFDSAQVHVDHLSPRLIGLTESGSYWCGGAHPDNYITRRFADARSGEMVVAEELLKGWVASDEEGKPLSRQAAAEYDGTPTWAPDAALVAYVEKHRQRFDAEMETDCGMSDLIAGNLGVYFRQDSLVFTLKDLPFVNVACTEDLLEVPLKDARPLLTEESAGYFEALDR